jgi:serine/threonine protein kinase
MIIFILFSGTVAGGDLSGYLISLGQPLREPTAAHVFHQIVSAISFIPSRGIAHRDLKPQTILIRVFLCVNVTDFGLCGMLTSGKMSTFCDSPRYTAPERLRKLAVSSKRTARPQKIDQSIEHEFPWRGVLT